MFKKPDKETINTICNILRTAIAAVGLIVAIESCKMQSPQQSQPEVPIPTETQYQK